MLTDLKKRRDHLVAIEIKDILENHQDGIGKQKFDIGRVERIECKIKMKLDAKP